MGLKLMIRSSGGLLWTR